MTIIDNIKEDFNKVVNNYLEKNKSNEKLHAAQIKIIDPKYHNKYGDDPEDPEAIDTYILSYANFTINNLGNYIKDKIELADARRNIVTHTIEANSNDLKPLGLKTRAPIKIRDCRPQKVHIQPPPSEIKENWLALAANYTRGALNLIDIADNGKTKETKNAIHNAFKNAMKHINEEDRQTKEWAKEIQTLNTCLLTELKQANLNFGTEELKNDKDIEKAIVQSRDYCNLQDKQPHIVTISANIGEESNKQYSVVEGSIRVNPLSDTIKSDYQAIKDYYNTGKDRASGKDKVKPEDLQEEKGQNLPQWYKKLSPVEKKLLEQNIDQILAGKTISSQLTNLPGLKNAFLELQGVAKNNSLKKNTTNHLIRCGAAAPINNMNKTDAIQYTKYNINHLRFLNDFHPIELNVLNTGNTLNIKAEGKITNRTEQAVGELAEQDVIYKNIPFSGKISGNTMRILGAMILAPVTGALDIISFNKLKLTKKILDKALHHDKSKRIEEVIKDNAGITTKVIMCKSGKDRTGIAVMAWIIKQVKTKEKDQDLTIIANTGHQETLAGG